MVRVLEIDVLQAERIASAVVVCEIVPVAIEPKSIAQGEIVVLPSDIAQIGDNAVYLLFIQMLVFILFGEEGPQILFDNRVCVFPVNVVAECILPVYLSEKFNSCFLELAFIIFPFVCHNRCGLRMYDVLEQCRTHFTRKPVCFLGYLLCFVGTFVDIDNCLLNFDGWERNWHSLHISKIKILSCTSP